MRHNIIAGLIVFVITAPLTAWISYVKAFNNAANEMGAGLDILNVHKTCSSLQSIIDDCQEAIQLLEQHLPQPSDETLQELREGVDEFSAALKTIKVTEYYSVAELETLASWVGFSSDKKDFLEKNIGKPKRKVEGLRELEPQLSTLAEMINTLGKQLEQEPRINRQSLTNILAKIEQEITVARTSLEDRHEAALKTLVRFGLDAERTDGGSSNVPVP